MNTVYRAGERGRGDYGPIRSRHSFSFGRFHDPARMGISHLRVLNDDWVAPGAGFPAHGHRDMEIISYVTSGVMELVYPATDIDPFRAPRIRQIKAQLAGNGPALVKSCNAELANPGGSLRARRCGAICGVARS